MTLTQTYRLAHRARGKLSSEASRGDHDLRLLVGHANLLDSLMVELQDAEREQDAWFEKSITKPAEPKVTFAPSVEQHQLDIPDVSDDEEEEESDDEEPRKSHLTVPTPSRRQRTRSPPASVSHHTYDDEDDMIADDDDESDSLELALTRTQSHPPSKLPAVPELVHESDSSDSEESDEEEMDTSKPTAAELSSQYVVVKDFAAATQTQRQFQKQQKEATMEAMEVADEDMSWLLPNQTSGLIAVC